MSVSLALTVFLTRSNNREQNEKIGGEWFRLNAPASTVTKDSIKSNT